MESPEAMKNFHRLVGDDIFRASLRRHMDVAYKSALKPFKGQSEIDQGLVPEGIPIYRDLAQFVDEILTKK